MGIEVEVRAHGVAQPVLIGQRASGLTGDRRTTPGAFPVGGSDSARLGRGSVPNPPNGGTWSVQYLLLPARVPPAIGRGCPGGATDLRNGPQQRGKDQNSGVFAPVITRLGILRKKGRALRVVGGRRRRGFRNNSQCSPFFPNLPRGVNRSLRARRRGPDVSAPESTDAPRKAKA